MIPPSVSFQPYLDWTNGFSVELGDEDCLLRGRVLRRAAST